MSIKSIYFFYFVLIVFSAGYQPIYGNQEKSFCLEAKFFGEDTTNSNRITEEKLILAKTNGAICRTPYMICQLSQPGPIGADCWCIGPSGPIKGVIFAD